MNRPGGELVRCWVRVRFPHPNNPNFQGHSLPVNARPKPLGDRFDHIKSLALTTVEKAELIAAGDFELSFRRDRTEEVAMILLGSLLVWDISNYLSRHQIRAHTTPSAHASCLQTHYFHDGTARVDCQLGPVTILRLELLYGGFGKAWIVEGDTSSHVHLYAGQQLILHETQMTIAPHRVTW